MARLHMPKAHMIAYGALICAQVAIAVNIVVGKFLIGEIPTFVFLSIRFFLSAVILSLIYLLCQSRLVSEEHPTGHLTRVDWLFLLLQAFMGGFLFNYFFFWGMEYTTAISAGIISSTLPAIIMVCAVLFLGEKLTLLKVLAILCAMTGVVIVSMHHATVREVNLFRNLWGDILVFIALIPEALYSIFNKFSGRRFIPLGNATVVNWLIFFMILPLGYFDYQEFYAPYAVLFWELLLISALTNVVFYWAWPKGLLVVPANTAAIFGALVPVVTSVLGWFFLHEIFGWHEGFGLLLAFTALLLGIDWHHHIHPPALEKPLKID